MTSLKYNIKSLKKIREKSNTWLAEQTAVLAAKLERLMIVCNGYSKIQPIRLSKSAASMGSGSRNGAGAVAGAAGKRPDCDVHMLSRQQPQFRPCLGSQKRYHPSTPTPISVMNKYEVRPVQPLAIRPLHTHSSSSSSTTEIHRLTVVHRQDAPPMRPSLSSEDSLHWGTDLAHHSARTSGRCLTPAPLTVRKQRHPDALTSIGSPNARNPPEIPADQLRPHHHQHQPHFQMGKCERHRRADCERMISEINRACAVAETRLPSAGTSGKRRRRQLVRQRTAPAVMR